MVEQMVGLGNTGDRRAQVPLEGYKVYAFGFIRDHVSGRICVVRFPAFVLRCIRSHPCNFFRINVNDKVADSTTCHWRAELTALVFAVDSSEG